VLLSSLQGAAISAVRIDGVLHEFSTLPGVIEDVTEIILNLKQVRLKLHGDGPKKGTVEIKGKGEVQAKDIQVDTDVQVLNPDLHIATLNRDGDLRMEVEISGGRGYVSADQHSQVDRPIGVIPIDSMFSPVTKVNYDVETTRLGSASNTTSSCSRCGPTAASCRRTPSPWRRRSCATTSRCSSLRGADRGRGGRRGRRGGHAHPPDARQERRGARAVGALEQLPARRRDQDDRDLVRKSEAEMLKYRNFGRKSLKEIQDILARWACTSAWTSAASPSRATRWGWRSKGRPAPAKKDCRMRHRKDHRKLSRTHSHRRAVLRNLVTALFQYERSRPRGEGEGGPPLAERMITFAKRGDSRRAATSAGS
jgi:DNA-directed RNA polymerase subunit alpha